MKDNTVIIKKEGPVAWVTMNRPESLNSRSVWLCAARKAARAECEDDNDIRVVVLSGEGTLGDIEKSESKPTYILDDIRELLRRIRDEA